MHSNYAVASSPSPATVEDAERIMDGAYESHVGFDGVNLERWRNQTYTGAHGPDPDVLLRIIEAVQRATGHQRGCLQTDICTLSIREEHRQSL